ncbi:MAG: iron ABC transporter permease [Armatimonadota bacterium]
MPPRRPDARTLLLIGGALVVGCLMLHIAFGGTVRLSLGDILREVSHGPVIGGESSNVIVWQIRLPRALGTMLVGGVLALVGAAFQSLFRNPLAEPYTVGASGGATVGGTLVVMAGLAGFAGLGTVVGAVAGALAAVLVVVGLAQTRPQLLLAGVVVSTLTASLTTVLLLSSGHDSNQVMRWLLGSTSALLWPQVLMLVLGLVLALVVFVRVGRALNVLASTESAAESLGVDSRLVSRWVLVVGAVATAVTVGTVGIIGFVGMVGPLIARRLIGSDARMMVSLASCVGGILLLLADLVAQMLVPGRELPVGAVTAVLGAPVFLAMVRKRA